MRNRLAPVAFRISKLVRFLAPHIAIVRNLTGLRSFDDSTGNRTLEPRINLFCPYVCRDLTEMCLGLTVVRPVLQKCLFFEMGLVSNAFLHDGPLPLAR